MDNLTNQRWSYGVFIGSSKCDDEIIERCQKLLQDMNLKTNIVSVKNDKAYPGLKVFLNDESSVKELIKRKCLCGSGEDSAVHALTTHLTVHDVHPISDEEFAEDLRNAMNDLGPVLEVSSIPFSKTFPKIGSGKWRVVLDVPEVEELEVFKIHGLPDNMILEIPSFAKRFRVTYHCNLCGKDGHTQSRCLFVTSNQDLNEAVHESRPPDVVPKDKIVGWSTNKVTKGFRMRDKEDKDVGGIPKPRSALPRNDFEANTMEIKKEMADNSICYTRFSSETDVLNPTHERLPDENTLDVEFLNEIIFSDSDDYSHFGVLTPSNRSKIPYLIPSTEYKDSYSEQQSSSSGNSNKIRKKPEFKTIVIPDGVRLIIKKIEGVLDADQLELFFNHTRKKSHKGTCRIALEFTSNVEGLKTQLKNIKREYYLSKETNTKSEEQFIIKRIGHVLERLDGTTVKIKK